MSREHTYLPSSWESVTRQIKQHFEMECLTEAQAKTILALYIKGVDVQKIINVMEGRNESIR